MESGLPLYFDNFFYPFNALLDVLDIAAAEHNMHAFTETGKGKHLHTQSPIEKAIEFLKTILNPERIFLLHHFNNAGKKQQVDLLAVIPATTTTSFSYCKQVLQRTVGLYCSKGNTDF